MKKRSGNLQLTSPGIQKDIVNAISLETLKVIFEELGDDFFAILVDESSDVSYKEQMAIILRFVNKEGILVEHFVGITHVTNTSAISLKSAIDELFDEYKLSLSRVRGQGYDGASNMRGQFGGLKALIQKDNSSAHYIHCFAHQLQLTLVATAKGHVDVVWFFDLVYDVVNVIGSSCKRRGVFRELRAIRIAQAISNGEIEMGKGLNQELGIKRSGDTRWGSHYRSVLNLQASFLDVIDLQELNDRFDEVNTELLRCVSCLSPKDKFRAFNLSKIEEMANFYPYDFDVVLVRVLSGELKNYIVDVRCHDAFAGLKGLGDLARVMVETRKNIIYPHVYLLIKLALILPVATAIVERAFSAMKYIKTKSRNRMSDTYLNDCLVTYIERDICESISIESIMHRFQNTKTRRVHYA
ncbi:uncharacterized protein LOC141649882 [Silene latifolia]|uniref:uncharacterized protein LOC141649882 n=1 Tax=Silene latifolia TaxID=37657 RepID=UPI003D78A0BA